MENASKALLIAGGILIAIILISIFISMYNNMSSFQKNQEQKKEMDQLAAFNAEFEAFDKKVMYGTDVITLANKVQNNNKKNGEDSIVLYLNNTKVNNGNELIDSDENFKTKMFKCTIINYNELGRVSQIYISNY